VAITKYKYIVAIRDCKFICMSIFMVDSGS